MVNCGENCYLPRPLSIHRTDGEKLALLFEIVGKGTKWLSQLKPGDSINIFGPLGNGFTICHGSKNLLLVSGGMGIAPLIFLAQDCINKGHSVTLLYGARTKKELYPAVKVFFALRESKKNHQRDLQSPLRQINVRETTEDGSIGRKGLVTDLLPEFADRADQLFACGPVGMYQAMARMPELRNKSVQVSLEMRMACGVGVCYSCTIKTRGGLKQVCKDGPIFDLEDIIWEEMGGV
jgi:dihydroorotate dehydrogenase electron transfer subunit